MAKDPKQVVYHPFFFSFPSLDQTNFVFRKLIKGDDFLILVIGEQGSGKTTFLERFIAATKDAWTPCRIKISSFQKKRREMGPQHSIAGESNAYITKKKHPQVLMVDDAQLLGMDAILGLLHSEKFAEDGRSLDKIVLFCEPNFTETLSQLKPLLPNQSGIKKLFLPMLTEKETTSFLFKWIEETFDSEAEPVNLERRQIKTIYRLSTGKPGQILEGAKQLLRKNHHRTLRSSLTALVAAWRQRKRHADVLIF